MTGNSIRVVIADDNAVIRLGLGQMLDNADGIELVADVADGEQAVAAVELHRPDVLLLDVRMPGKLDGVTTAGLVADRTAVVMMTYSDEADVVQAAVRAGARGYLVHGDTTPDQIVAAVRDAAEGRPTFSTSADVALLALIRANSAPDTATGASDVAPANGAGGVGGLSPREQEILAMISDGQDNNDIAKALVISRHTVNNHITRIFTKLGVRTRHEAIALWWREERAVDRDGGPRTAGSAMGSGWGPGSLPGGSGRP